jgi:hypothetical protein
VIEDSDHRQVVRGGKVRLLGELRRRLWDGDAEGGVVVSREASVGHECRISVVERMQQRRFSTKRGCYG